MLKITTYVLPALCKDYLKYKSVVSLNWLSKNRIIVSIDETKLPDYCDIQLHRASLEALQLASTLFAGQAVANIVEEKLYETSRCLVDYLQLESGKDLGKQLALHLLIWFLTAMLFKQNTLDSFIYVIVGGIVTAHIHNCLLVAKQATTFHMNLDSAIKDLKAALAEAVVEKTVESLVSEPTGSTMQRGANDSKNKKTPLPHSRFFLNIKSNADSNDLPLAEGNLIHFRR